MLRISKFPERRCVGQDARVTRIGRKRATGSDAKRFEHRHHDPVDLTNRLGGEDLGMALPEDQPARRGCAPVAVEPLDEPPRARRPSGTRHPHLRLERGRRQKSSTPPEVTPAG